jgi:type IV secretory pathway TrbD component
MGMMTITGQGLRWMAALVIVLWGCVVAEDMLVKHARKETVQVLVTLRHLREAKHIIPVSQPLRAPAPNSKPAIG